MKTKLDKLIRFALLAPFVTAMVIYGSTKPKPGPNFSFDNTYIGDGGSYATNDTVHVELARRIMELPIDDCDVIAYMRVRSSNSAADYVMLPTYKFGEYPVDFTVQNATNYNYWFYLDYVPPSPVHTNGVFELRGFEVAGEPRVPNPIFSAGFAQSAIVDNREIVPIEYLESTGTQYIKTGFTATDSMSYKCVISPTSLAYNSGFFGYRFTGSATAYGNMRFSFIYNDGRIGLRNGLDVQNSTQKLAIGSIYDIEVDNQYVKVDGNAWISADNKKAAMNPPGEAWLFFVNCTGHYNVDVQHPVSARLYAFQIFDNGVLVRDYIPVRVGRVGYMFDRVSGEYLPFGNAGTGSFILGPDIKE